MAPYISCKQVVKAFTVSGHEIVALRGVDFEMQRGELVAIIGPSGAGKSTMLNLLGGLDKPTAGKLIVDDLDLLSLKGAALADYRLKKVGFLWQQTGRNLLPHRSALRNVTLPMMMAGLSPWKRAPRAREILEAVGLQEHMYKRPGALSGGQQQRVGLAVALANHPPLLLADEPTGALDRKTAVQVMDLLNDLRHKMDLTVLMVTHDLDIAKYADRVLTLRDGALGQDLSGHGVEGPKMDATGHIQLPEQVRAQLTAPRIAVEIRPEGVLLRPESDQVDDTTAAVNDIGGQDAPPEHRRFRLFGRRKKSA